MTTQFQELLSQPFFPWFILAILAVGWGLSQVDRHVPDDPIELFKKKLGISNWPHILVLVPILAWLTLFSLLSWGLCTVIADIAWNVAQPQKLDEQGDFRFLLTKTAALTAVLGAMVALPFTIYRLKLTTEQNKHNENVLFNDKLNDANNDLHARYQTSEKQDNGTYIDIWNDDIIRRNGAIDRLEALATERPNMAPRIARMLCVYLTEMTSAHPAELPPDDLIDVPKWSKNLTLKRSDMENAAQVLGRLHKNTGVDHQILNVVLAGINLQAMNLENSNFQNANLFRAHLSGANLYNTNLQGANLAYAQLIGIHAMHVDLNYANLDHASLQFASLYGSDLRATSLYETKLTGLDLSYANLHETYLPDDASFDSVELNKTAFRDIDLTEVDINQHSLEHSFGDNSVLLPYDVVAPKHWAHTELTDAEFDKSWEDFQNSLPSYSAWAPHSSEN